MLSVYNISYEVKNKTILYGITFNAKPNEFVGIIGANGAGKSSLINIINNKQSSKTGKINWFKQNIATIKIDELAKIRGVLTQQNQVGFTFKANEIVMMGRYPHFKNNPSVEDYNYVNTAAEITDTTPFLNRTYQTLSGGEQQRIQLSRVLAQVSSKNKASKLLILDEPLNNLDIKHQHHILKNTKQFAKEGNVVLTVLHDINLAAVYCDKILVLKDGKNLAFGTPNEVLTEEILNTAYDFPVKVTKHPFNKCPVVFFGYNENLINA